MTDLQFRYFLDLIMVSDPWPLDVKAGEELIALANEESVKRGFENWIYAYHKHMKE